MQTGIGYKILSNGGGNGADIANMLYHGCQRNGHNGNYSRHQHTAVKVVSKDGQRGVFPFYRKTDPCCLRNMLNQGFTGGSIHNHGEYIACNYAQQNGNYFQHALAPDVKDDDHKNGNQCHQPVVAAVVNGTLGQSQTNGDDNRTGNNRRKVTHDLLCAKNLEQQSQYKIQKSGASDTKAGIGQWNLCAGGGNKAISP